ncbi:MAG: hypothetical protein ACRC41_00285 [Sarcina sp.]
MKTIKFNHLKKYQLTKTEFKISKKNIEYEIKVLNKNTDKTLIIISSEIKSSLNFKRESLFVDMPYNIVFINDPTPQLNDIEVGWGQGTEDIFVIDEMSQIIEIILNKLDTSKNYFFGSGAGGFISIYLATLFKGVALGAEAHFYPLNFYTRHVSNMKQKIYINYSESALKKVFKSRISCIDFFKILDYIPKIYLLYNIKSQYYKATQIQKFLLELDSEEFESLEINLEIYSDIKNIDNGTNNVKIKNFIEKIMCI